MTYAQKKELENQMVALLEKVIYGLLIGSDEQTYKELQTLPNYNRADMLLGFVFSDDVQAYIDNEITEVELSKRLGTDGVKEYAKHFKTDMNKLRPKIQNQAEKLIEKYQDKI